MQPDKNPPKQCGICERWIVDGELLPSGNRDPENGLTPHDNFVCGRCQNNRRILIAEKESIAARQGPSGLRISAASALVAYRSPVGHACAGQEVERVQPPVKHVTLRAGLLHHLTRKRSATAG
jgi:hypothetical protein